MGVQKETFRNKSLSHIKGEQYRLDHVFFLSFWFVGSVWWNLGSQNEIENFNKFLKIEDLKKSNFNRGQEKLSNVHFS